MSVTRMKIPSRRSRMLLILPAAAGVALVVGAGNASASPSESSPVRSGGLYVRGASTSAARRRHPHGSAYLARHRAPHQPGLHFLRPRKRTRTPAPRVQDPTRPPGRQ
jgi:hypothetical protein